MVSWSQDFADFTAFERLVLNLVAPLTPLQSPAGAGGRRDLRNNTATVALGVPLLVSCDNANEKRLEAALKPLAFGAAWKVIDLLVEFALYGHPHGGHVPIKEKVRAARVGACPPFSADIWRRVVGLYANTIEARHCLVHRHFQVGASGDLTGLQNKGIAVRDITGSEQDAFCRLAQRIADAVIAGTMRPRALGDVAWLLNQLADHHGESPIAGDQALDVRLIIADAENTPSGWSLDVTGLLELVQASHRNGTLFDLELHFPGTSHAPIYCALDEAPSGTYLIDPTCPPSWLSFTR